MEQNLEVNVLVEYNQLQELINSLKRLESTVQKSMGGVEKATQRGSQGMTRVASSAKRAERSTHAFNDQTMNLTKSVQVALGPLSGIAARITALSALFNRNAFLIATSIAAFTGFTVATTRAIKAGQDFDVQMRSLNTVIAATGRTAETSAEQLNEMARRLGSETLSSADQMRQAQVQLLTFRNVAVESFGEALKAAEGLSQSMGGDLQANIRQIGRLLEDPARNFDALVRRGIQFNSVEREKIRNLQESGRLLEAQSIVMERLNPFIQLATGNTGGLAGAIDDLGQRMMALLEESAVTSTLLSALADTVRRVDDRLKQFLENEEAVRKLGEAFSLFVNIVASGVALLIDHFDKLAALISGAVVFAIASRLVPSMVALATQLQLLSALNIGLAGAISIKVKALWASIRAKEAATVAARGLVAAYAPLTIALVAANLVLNRLNRDMEEADNTTKDYTNTKVGLIEVNDLLISSLNEEARAKLELIRVEQQLKNDQVLRNQEQLEALKEEERALNRKLDSSWRNRDAAEAVGKQLAQNRAEQRRLTSAIQAGTEAVNEYNSVYADMTGRLSEAERKTSELFDRMNRLAGLYDREANSIRTLENHYRALENLKHEAVNATDEERAAILRAAISYGLLEEGATNSAEAIEEIIKAAERMQREILRQIDAPQREIQRLADRYTTLRAENGKLAAELSGKPLGFSLRDMRDLERLTIDQLKRVAEFAGIDISGLQDELEVRTRIAESIETQRRNQEALQNAERALSQIRSQELDIYRSQLDENQQITFDFALQRAEILKASHLMEQEALQAHMDELDRIEQAAQEQRQRTLIEGQMGQFKTTIDNFKKMEELASVGGEGMVAAFGIGFGMMADTMKGALGESHALYKAFAIAQATMAASVAINKALQEGGPFAGPALAAMIAVQAGVQIGTIAAQRFAQGGLVRGPGTGISDSVPALLSRGEYVMKASAVRNLGVGTLDMLNNPSSMPAFAMGGAVGAAPGGGVGATIININDMRSSGEQVSVDEQFDAEGNRVLELTIRDQVRKQLGSGTLDKDMAKNYGQSRRPIRR